MRTSKNAQNANFAYHAFCELRHNGVLRSSTSAFTISRKSRSTILSIRPYRGGVCPLVSPRCSRSRVDERMGRCTTLYNWGHSTTRNEKGMTHTENLLKNKTAVVYGAGSIGSAVATAFAKAGATVFVADHSEEASKRFADKNIQTEQVDVLDTDAVAAFEPGHISQTLN